MKSLCHAYISSNVALVYLALSQQAIALLLDTGVIYSMILRSFFDKTKILSYSSGFELWPPNSEETSGDHNIHINTNKQCQNIRQGISTFLSYYRLSHLQLTVVNQGTK